MTEDLTCAQRSLLQATQLLWAASQNDIDVDLATNLPEVLLQSAVRMLVWQAVSLLPDRLAWQFARLEPFGFPILLVLLFTGILGEILWPLIVGFRFLLSTVFGF